MDEQSRLTYLTRYYLELQGLRLAPVWIAILCFVFALRHISADCNCLGWGVLWGALGLLALMVLWFWLAGRYYRNHFGWLKPTTYGIVPKGRLWWTLLPCLLVWMIYCLVTGSRASEPYLLPFLLIYPMLDAENPQLRRAAYGAGGGLIAASALFVQLAHRDVHRNATIYAVILCVVMLALGIGDHLLLMSLRAPVLEDADG